MSNTPNEDANVNSGGAPNYGNPAYYGNPPQQTNYGSPQQGPYGTPPNYPPYGYPVGQQGPYGVPPNYPPPYGAPQQGPYGYGANPEYDLNMPPPGYGYNNLNAPSPANRPLPLAEAIRQLPRQYWRVLTKPGAATFAMEQGKAAWDIVWVQIIGLTLFTVLIGFASIAVTTALLTAGQSSSASSIDAFKGYLYLLPFSYVLLTPLGLFISLGIYHLIAKMFGGSGTFLAYMYSYLLFGVPLTLLTILLILIPFVGSLVGSAVSIYIIVLQVFMTMGVHRLSGGKATFAVLLLPIIGVVLLIVGFVVLFSLFISAYQHAYPH